MRILITGITGFAGSHLADYCLERGDVEVHGIIRWRSRTEQHKEIERFVQEPFKEEIQEIILKPRKLRKAAAWIRLWPDLPYPWTSGEK